MKARLRTMTVSLAASAVLATTFALATPAEATPWYCNAWITSTGRPGGGVSGMCQRDRGQYRVVGLCQNIFSRGSRWVYGQWVALPPGGVSYAGCAWYEIPRGAYTQAR